MKYSLIGRIKKTLSSIATPYKPFALTYPCTPGTQEIKTERSEVQIHPQLQTFRPTYYIQDPWRWVEERDKNISNILEESIVK